MTSSESVRKHWEQRFAAAQKTGEPVTWQLGIRCRTDALETTLKEIEEIGAERKQQVVMHRYNDMVDHDGDEVRAQDDECTLLWSYYHGDDCDHCNLHKKNERGNPVLRITIKPNKSQLFTLQ